MAHLEGKYKGGTPLIELYDHGSKYTMLKFSDFKGRNTGVDEPLIQKDITKPHNINALSIQGNARIDDLARITKLLTKPGGIKFATNQALLNTAANTSSDNIFKKLGGGVFTAAKAIGSTLAQVPVNGTGLHFVYGFGGHEYLRQGQEGRTPLGRFLRNQLNIGNQGINAGPAALAGRQIIPDNTGAENYQPLTKSGLLELNSTLDLTPDDIQKSLDFLPPSFQNVAQGIRGAISNIFRKKTKGETTTLGDFFKAQPDTLDGDTTPESSVLLQKIKTNLSLFSNGDREGTSILGQPDIPETYTGRDGRLNRETLDITSTVIDQQTERNPQDSSYLKVDGAVVARSGGRVSINSVKGSTIDDQNSQMVFQGGTRPINTNLAPSEARADIKIPLYYLKDGEKYNLSPLNLENKFWLEDSNVDLLATQTEELTGRQDIIPFRFNTFTPSGEKFLYFRAFLDSLDDSYDSDWSGTRYIGRAEEFFTYQGMSRKISFSFKVAALSKKHLIPLYEKLNYLASATAPTYGASGQFMRGTFCNLTIGDYLYEQDGFINSVKITWQKEYPWEIDVDNADLPIVPHMLDISIDFTPVHNFNVKEDINNTTERYFGPRTGTVGTVEVGEGEFGPVPRGKTAFAYFAGKTIEYDVETGKTVAINGQPVKSANGGWAYAADGRQAVSTKVNGTNATIFDQGTDDNGNPMKKVVTNTSGN